MLSRSFRGEPLLPTSSGYGTVDFLDSDDDTSRVREAYGDHSYRRRDEVKAKSHPESALVFAAGGDRRGPGAGGAAMAFVGLSLVGVRHNRVIQACGSAMGFVMKGGRLHRLGQAPTGLAFAVYCAGCCGPLLIPLYLFAAASGSLLLGTIACAGFALAMAVPVAILGLMGRRWTSLLRGVVDNNDVISSTSGMALLTLGLLLVLNRPLIAVLDALHGLLGE